jgi:2-oxoglutarate ferredoxin oxidoreductase subunit alpha
MDGAEVAIFAYGSVARSALAVVRAARAQGARVGMVRPITLWPFPTLAVERMAEQVRTVIVPEMNIKQMSWEVQAAVKGRAKVVDHGRVDGKLITPEEIFELVKPEFPYHRWEDA